MEKPIELEYEEDSAPSEVHEPKKPKQKREYVMTEARAAAVERMKEARAKKVAGIQEKKKNDAEMLEKAKFDAEMLEKAKLLASGDESKAKPKSKPKPKPKKQVIVLEDSDSSSEEENQIVIRRKRRKTQAKSPKTPVTSPAEEEIYQPPPFKLRRL